ncbi:hypothetical protein COV16_06525 [Candidatus Woesearchaeota archaeon CG10_big_fil_rev_8_21_14_0_10_34_8]|nr:MAG: hypothetical protein COV16_06525 [Candidatus Woesearchaeota archaeon CG10_big_fil_rev_8_21_14_0_10_34_8]
MTRYSHSRLGTFQQCKYKYKLQYVDRIKVDIPDTVETFMGKLVHEALEKLFKDLQYQKINSKEDLIKFFEAEWKKRWTDTIIVAKKEYTADNYKEMGKKFIKEFYDHYKPFNHLKTLGLETEDSLDLEDGNQYHIRIDRLACDKEGNYFVCDYKTNNKLKAQEELDEDRQLAMYSLWVKKNFADCQNVKLVWYFLAFDKEMVSERSDEQLEQLEIDTQELIKEIEACQEWPTNVTPLCGWCKFKSMCPAWKHEFELEKKSAKEFKEDDGVKLVDELTAVEEEKKKAEARISEIREDLITFSQQKGINTVFGTKKKAKVSAFDRIVYPKTEEFYSLLKEKGIWDDVITLNYSKFLSQIRKRNVDTDVLEQIETEQSWKITLSKRKKEQGDEE